MNFAIHFRLSGIIDSIPAGSIMYSIAFIEDAEAYVILTSDIKLTDGTIHAIRFAVDKQESDEDAVAEDALDKCRELIHLKGMIWRSGIMLTEGLNDALRFYGKSGVTYSLKQLDELLIDEKNRQEAAKTQTGFPPFLEESKDK